MEPLELDEVDRGILHALQADARTATAAEMAEQVGVSASTVRNRLARLEEGGVVRGYHPEIDYERANLQLHVLIVTRAPPVERAELAERALELTGVITVRELLTGAENLHIEAVAVDSDTVDELVGQVDDLGVEIVSADIVKRDHLQPFNHFGAAAVEE